MRRTTWDRPRIGRESKHQSGSSWVQRTAPRTRLGADLSTLGSDKLLLQRAPCLTPKVLRSVCLQTPLPRAKSPSSKKKEKKKSELDIPSCIHQLSPSNHSKAEQTISVVGTKATTEACSPAKGTSVLKKYPVNSYE